jgi:hypothetical protein
MELKLALFKKTGKFLLILVFVYTLTGCYHYRVLNTVNDPASVQYHHKVLWAYFWGLTNSPRNFTVNDCSSGGIDEVRITTNFGETLLTIGTLGIVCPVKVEWKCHKPCQRTGDL